MQTLAVVVGEDLDACRRPFKEILTLYVGGMGARDKNSYTCRMQDMGYEDAAVAIRDLFLAGRKEGAVPAVPDTFFDGIAPGRTARPDPRACGRHLGHAARMSKGLWMQTS